MPHLHISGLAATAGTVAAALLGLTLTVAPARAGLPDHDARTAAKSSFAIS